MAILIVYNILPVILLLVYPMKPFRKCLYKLKLNFVALNLFMDTFQGCYKDGTADTRDLRSFSCLYFLLRLFFILVRLLATYGWHWGVVMLLFASATIIIATFKPYKWNVHNFINIAMLGILMLISIAISWSSSIVHSLDNFHCIFFIYVSLCACCPFFTS